MDLKFYFYKRNIRGRDISKKIGISHAAFSQILNGNRIPHKKTAKGFEIATNGEVTADEVMEYCLRQKLEKFTTKKKEKSLKQKPQCSDLAQA